MKPAIFAEQTELLEATELEKVKLLAFYLLNQKEKSSFNINTIMEIFEELHLPKPNISRLTKKIKESSAFINGSEKGSFKLHAKELKSLELLHPLLKSKTEEILSEETIIPHSLIRNTRGYIESLSKQINASYQHNIFDGCAVLMRRLLEILLILANEASGNPDKIKTSDGTYTSLENIIQESKSSKSLALSRDTKSTLDAFRELGNFSAHKIHYNARRSDIDQIKNKFRATIEELLYKSKIKS